MKHLIKTTLAACVVLGATSIAAQADPKPRPSKALSAQVVANKFAGSMQVWKSCQGGIYFGGGWEAVAYCGKHKNSVGVGTWTTRGGKICYEMTWHFVKDGTKQTKKNPMKCEVEMVSDKDGQVWHSWHSDKEWWRGFPRDKNFTKGNKYKRQISRLRKKLGV